jgi:hypothetical protein
MAEAFGVQVKDIEGNWVFIDHSHAILAELLLANHGAGCFTPAFRTGQGAAEFATHSLSVPSRIRPLDDTWKIFTEMEALSLPEFFKREDTWREREKARFADGTYTALPWVEETWFKNGHDMLEHFVHVSLKDKRRVSYTESAAKGRADRQTAPMNVGRYFTRFKAEYGLDDTDIAELSARYAAVHGGEWELEFARTPDEIEAAYTSGKPGSDGRYSPTSCMSYGAGEYKSHVHPVRVYGAGDLAVAFLCDPDDRERIVARALCWPDKKIYGTVYGNEAALEWKLASVGYEKGEFLGARLLKIPHGRTYVMPYIDDIADIGDIGEFFVIGGNLDATGTDGLLDNAQRNVCENCYAECDDDNYEDGMCVACRDDISFICAYDGARYVDAWDITTPNGEMISERNSRHYFECHITGYAYLLGEAHGWIGSTCVSAEGHDELVKDDDERLAKYMTAEERESFNAHPVLPGLRDSYEIHKSFVPMPELAVDREELAHDAA